MNRTSAYAAHAGLTVPGQPSPAVRERGADRPAPVVRDLRDRAGRSPHALLFGPRDVVVVTGLPGSGKSTLMHRAVTGRRVDSQDTRDRWQARVPGFLPYALYRPWSASPTTPDCAGPCAPGRGSSCTTAAPSRGCAPGWPAKPGAGAAPCTCSCSTSAPRRPGRASASAAGASPATPSAATAAPPPGCCARWSGGAAGRLRRGGAAGPGRGGRPRPRRLHSVRRCRCHPLAFMVTAVVPSRR